MKQSNQKADITTLAITDKSREPIATPSKRCFVNLRDAIALCLLVSAIGVQFLDSPGDKVKLPNSEKGENSEIIHEQRRQNTQTDWIKDTAQSAPHEVDFGRRYLEELVSTNASPLTSDGNMHVFDETQLYWTPIPVEPSKINHEQIPSNSDLKFWKSIWGQ